MAVDRERMIEARACIAAHLQTPPRLAIIIGTGLEGILKAVRTAAAIPYTAIPGFVRPTVSAHAGTLVLGTLGGTPVVVMNGRCHLYEGYTVDEVTFPVYVMRVLGATHLLVSNACGGINSALRAGSIVVVEDHINLMGVNPLMGPNDDRMGPRYPDMFRAYDPAFRDLALAAAAQLGIPVGRGVYAGVTGPNLETPAEYRWLKSCGADVVGMSTVPEIIAGVHCGFKNCGLSVVTDECWPEALKPVNIAEIIHNAERASGPLCRLVEAIAQRIGPVVE